MFRSRRLQRDVTDAPPPSLPLISTSSVCGRLRDFGVFEFDVLRALFFFVVATLDCGRASSSAGSASGTTMDLRARFEAVRGVLMATLADRTLLGVVVWRAAVDLRGERRLIGDSPFTPRARRSSTRGFPSAGTKILTWFPRESGQARAEHGASVARTRKHTHHGRESAI